ncbi:MAG: family 10 glycosylhydrolase [Flavonifractor plautii]
MTKFWKPLLAIALICALALAGLGLAAQSPAAAAQAKRADEFRAVWVATVYRLDYPSRATTDPAVLKRDADAILQGCVDMGMNAVILQVRPSADALYPSELYPWSKYLTGTQGTAPKTALIRWPTGWSGPMPWGWSSTPGSIPSASPRGRGGVPGPDRRPPCKAPPRLGGGVRGRLLLQSRPARGAGVHRAGGGGAGPQV